MYAVLISAASSCGGPGAEYHLLQGLGVPALEHPFMDIRGVAAWCEASGVGKNPATDASFITFPGEKLMPNFLMNYSPMVLNLRFIGLNQQHASVWGLILGALYVGAVCFLCGPCTLHHAVLWLILLLSPASVLVVERCNLDILLFALVVTALLLRKHPYGASASILAAGLIKFYPIGSLLAVWREEGKRSRIAVVLGVVLFTSFLLFLKSRLVSIGTSLMGQYQSSFGCGVAADLLQHYGILGKENYWLIRGVLVFSALGLLATAYAYGLFTSEKAVRRMSFEWREYAFFLTAPIMLGLFVLGNQMDYKWIFFLPMVPAVLRLLDSASLNESRIAKIWIGGVIAYSYWTFFSDEGSLRNSLMKQLVMWVVMTLTAVLAGLFWKKEIRNES